MTESMIRTALLSLATRLSALANTLGDLEPAARWFGANLDAGDSHAIELLNALEAEGQRFDLERFLSDRTSIGTPDVEAA